MITSQLALFFLVLAGVVKRFFFLHGCFCRFFRSFPLIAMSMTWGKVSIHPAGTTHSACGFCGGPFYMASFLSFLPLRRSNNPSRLALPHLIHRRQSQICSDELREPGGFQCISNDLVMLLEQLLLPSLRRLYKSDPVRYAPPPGHAQHTYPAVVTHYTFGVAPLKTPSLGSKNYIHGNWKPSLGFNYRVQLSPKKTSTQTFLHKAFLRFFSSSRF